MTATTAAPQNSAAEELARRSHTPIQRVQHLLHARPAISPAVVLVISVLVFSGLNSRFASANSLSLVIQQVAVVAALAVGQTLIILTAGIDLSVGAVTILSMMVMATVASKNHVPGFLALLIGLVLGVAAGFLNGFLVTRVKLPPFIVTLGSLGIFTAIGLLYSGGQSISSDKLPSLLNWTGNTFPIGSFRLTYGVVIVLVLYAVVAFALTQTAWGKHVYAVGDDAEASRLAGIRVSGVLLSRVRRRRPDLRDRRLDPDRSGRCGQPERAHRCKPGIDHRRGDRRGQPVRRPRHAHRVTHRRVHRRRVPQRPVPGRGQRPVPRDGRRRPHHRRRLRGPMDQEGAGMTSTGQRPDSAVHTATAGTAPTASRQPILEARGLVKTYGRVVGLDGVDLELYPGEVLAIIGDNGAGKSTLIKALTGAVVPDAGQVLLEGKEVHFRRPQDARDAGIETVYQTLAVAPALDIASNLFLGRERRRPGPLGSVLRMLDKKGMRDSASAAVGELGIGTIQNMQQTVETLSGGQRQAVSVARAAAFGSKVVVLDEPTAALGVKESNQVLAMIRQLRDKGLPIILISHNMPHVFEIADRIHIQRLGRRGAIVTPQSHTMNEAVAIMTGAMTVEPTTT